jgi:hypothetical protein
LTPSVPRSLKKNPLVIVLNQPHWSLDRSEIPQDIVLCSQSIIAMTSQPNLNVLGFVPEQLVPVSVGRYHVNLYPKLSPSASVVEHAHTFQIYKSALYALNIDIRLLFDALGSQINCMATIDGLVYDYTQVYKEGWYNPAHLQILLFHDSAGSQINTTTIAGDPTVLLPVIGGVLAN